MRAGERVEGKGGGGESGDCAPLDIVGRNGSWVRWLVSTLLSSFPRKPAVSPRYKYRHRREAAREENAGKKREGKKDG